MLDFALHTTTFPLLTAFLLGIVTMLSPCPFCSDVSAISYLSKEVSCMRCMVRDGVLYVLGKCFTYTVLALVFIFGGQVGSIRHFLETYGEPALGPLMVVVGVLMIVISNHNHNHNENENENENGNENGNGAGGANHSHKHWHTENPSTALGAFGMGATFALAFCPYSGLLYFGTLIPLTLSTPVAWSWTLPIVFGLGDALPVFALAWLLSKGAAGIGKLGGNLQKVEKTLRWLCVAIFIGFGLYLSIGHLTGHHEHHHAQTECIVHNA